MVVNVNFLLRDTTESFFQQSTLAGLGVLDSKS